MEHILAYVGVFVLVFAVAYLLLRINPGFVRNSSRAMFMRDLASRLGSSKRDTEQKERN
jgi:hypothetical protein